jgi:alpha-tubulin suppressor-like RCC1 family protein
MYTRATHTEATWAGHRRLRLRLALHLPVVILIALLGATSLPARASAVAPGQLYAFGNNFHGQLGNPDVTNEPHPTPTLVTLPGELGYVTQATAGGSFSLAVTSTGQLYAFGENDDGQLGNETNLEDIFAANPTATLVTLPGEDGPVTQAAAGSTFSLAITTTGQLYAFGNNRQGQLGNTTNFETVEPNPTPTLVTLPELSAPVAQVAAGGFFSLAATTTGQLYAFGENFDGQLGISPTGVDAPTPTLVPLPEAAGAVTAIAAGYSFSLVATSSGELYAFGENDHGQLGNADNDRPLEPHPTPTLVTLPGEVGPVTQVAAGSDHSLALTSSGQLYTFGWNRFGQLGITTNSGTPTANPTPTLVTLPGARGRVVRIAAGAEYSLALTSTGQLYAFGSDYYGELGFPPGEHQPKEEVHSTPRQVLLPGGNAETIATGNWSAQTLVVTADLSIETSSLPAGEIDIPYQAQAEGGGGTTPDLWSASGLPQGLAINPESGAISGTPTTAGTYDPTITLTDSDGIEASQALTMRIKAPDEPPFGNEPPPNEPPPGETSPPVSPIEPPPRSLTTETPLTSLPGTTPAPPSVRDARQSAARWHEGNRPPRIGHPRTPTGTTFSFSLNEPATVRFSFIRMAHGGLSCAARANGSTTRKVCDDVTAGTLSFAGHSGSNKAVFAGRIAHTTELKPGRYELTITATNSADQSSPPVALDFTISQ